MRFRAFGKVEASTYIGEIEAESTEEAVQIASELAEVSVCCQCSRRIQDPEVTEINLEPAEEVDTCASPKPQD